MEAQSISLLHSRLHKVWHMARDLHPWHVAEEIKVPCHVAAMGGKHVHGIFWWRTHTLCDVSDLSSSQPCWPCLAVPLLGHVHIQAPLCRTSLFLLPALPSVLQCGASATGNWLLFQARATSSSTCPPTQGRAGECCRASTGSSGSRPQAAPPQIRVR